MPRRSAILFSLVVAFWIPVEQPITASPSQFPAYGSRVMLTACDSTDQGGTAGSGNDAWDMHPGSEAFPTDTTLQLVRLPFGGYLKKISLAVETTTGASGSYNAYFNVNGSNTTALVNVYSPSDTDHWDAEVFDPFEYTVTCGDSVKIAVSEFLTAQDTDGQCATLTFIITEGCP